MIRGLYTAATSLITRQVQQENLSNNISNLNTPGYKKTNVALKTFEDILINRSEIYSDEKNRNKIIGQMNYGVGIDEVKIDRTQGIIAETNRRNDFAISDDRYMFNVIDNNGNVTLTRNGSFTVSNGGNLVDSQGRRVLGSNGSPIVLSGDQATFNSDGIITNSNGNVGFMLTEINPDTGAVVRQGGDLTSVKQGYLEGSNVNLVETMTDIITVSRNYESSQKVFQQLDETLSKAINEVGTVR